MTKRRRKVLTITPDDLIVLQDVRREVDRALGKDGGTLGSVYNLSGVSEEFGALVDRLEAQVPEGGLAGGEGAE